MAQDQDKVKKEAKCAHKRTRLIAKDDAAEYVECLDCGALLETSELTDLPEFPESLSDA